jgi:hypothetical protein
MRRDIYVFSYFYIFKKGGLTMSKLESKFQKDLIDEIKERYPGCVALKNDSSYIQGIPDWTIFYEDKWAVLEMKRERGARKQPNQEYYVDKLNGMSFSRFVYPENKDEVLEDLDTLFKRKRRRRVTHEI